MNHIKSNSNISFVVLKYGNAVDYQDGVFATRFAQSQQIAFYTLFWAASVSPWDPLAWSWSSIQFLHCLNVVEKRYLNELYRLQRQHIERLLFSATAPLRESPSECLMLPISVVSWSTNEHIAEPIEWVQISMVIELENTFVIYCNRQAIKKALCD